MMKDKMTKPNQNLKSMKTAVRSFSLISPTLSFREGKDNIEHPHQEGADVPIDVPWGGEHDVPLISAGHIQVKPHSPHITTGEDIYIQGVSGKESQFSGDWSEQAYDDLFNGIENDQVDQVDPKNKLIHQRVMCW